MNLLLCLFFFSLSLRFVSCEKCPMALHETFKENLDLSDKCEDCKILFPRIYFLSKNWTGFCVKCECFLFEEWKCRKEQELKKSGPFVEVTEEFCEHFHENYNLDMQCLSQYNAEMCGMKSEFGSSVNNGEEEVNPTEKGFLDPCHVHNSSAMTSTFLNNGITTVKPFYKRMSSTKTSPVKSTETSTIAASTSTETFFSSSTTTEAVDHSTSATPHSSSTSSSSTSSGNNTIPSSTTLQPSLKKTCELNEFFYNDHCYFIKMFADTYYFSGLRSKFQIEKSEIKEAAFSLIKSCRNQHPEALGLAVETEAENKFILAELRTIHAYDDHVILTSGFKVKGLPGEWIGWNLKVNQTLLNLPTNLSSAQSSAYEFYCINSCRNSWYLFGSKISSAIDPNIFIVCKRPYNPKNIQTDLYERCLELYRKSSCYIIGKHTNYCCAKDERGEIWFACPDQTGIKYYANDLVCNWSCKHDGFFSQDRPTCKGRFVCTASYKNVTYIAPIQRYALSRCPKSSSGYSSWYCSSNGAFLGTPDYSLCCEPTSPKCKDIDVFLNIWMGCPYKSIVKRTTCPPGSLRSEALVDWYCQSNGTFLGNWPNYDNCNKIDLMCSKKDRFKVEWTAVPGTIAMKNCPPSFTGDCFWKCEETGVFEEPEPDCSNCKSSWMNDIANKIKNHSQHEEVMAIMENYTKSEDIRIGFSHIITLTSDCVTLYKRQIVENKFTVFNKFLNSYSKILRNIAGDSSIWSSFSERKRGVYADQILKITQNAAFANLEIKDAPKEQYNATFSSSELDGFNFFVAYNPPTAVNFPLQNFSQSDWHLGIKNISDRVINFAAMGLIINRSLSSLMFPRGRETKNLALNAPTITFTVATATNGEVVIDPNVVVVISFKHANRTRFPATEVIGRKLHVGEHPSGVFNSTLCFYYRESDWSTEGCSVTYTSKDLTNCTCNHLSTIGLLMSMHKYERNNILELVSAVSSGITIVSLILALAVFRFIDKGNSDRVLIGKNLCLCLLIGHVMLFGVMDKKFFNSSDTMCKVYAILLHYVFMAAFAWMFVEGCHLYRMLVLVFDSNLDYRWIYMLIGYGVPLVIVGVTQLLGIIFQEEPYGQDELCWLKTPHYVWAFTGPVIVSTTINFCILIVAINLAISSKKRREKYSFATLRLWVKGWISLSTLLGITWLFGLGYIRYNETFVYVFVVFNGLQGFFIFLFRCVLCKQYKIVFLKKLKSWFWKSNPAAYKVKGNVKPETKVYLVSAAKSSSEVTEEKESGCEIATTSESHKDNRRHFTCKFLHQSKSEVPDPKDNPTGIGIDVNVTLTPAMSEAYLRNRMIAKNFSARKSKATLLADSEYFPERSHHYTSIRI